MWPSANHSLGLWKTIGGGASVHAQPRVIVLGVLRLVSLLQCSLHRPLSEPVVDLLLDGHPIVLVLFHNLFRSLLEQPFDHGVQAIQILTGMRSKMPLECGGGERMIQTFYTNGTTLQSALEHRTADNRTIEGRV